MALCKHTELSLLSAAGGSAGEEASPPPGSSCGNGPRVDSLSCFGTESNGYAVILCAPSMAFLQFTVCVIYVFCCTCGTPKHEDFNAHRF